MMKDSIAEQVALAEAALLHPDGSRIFDYNADAKIHALMTRHGQCRFINLDVLLDTERPSILVHRYGHDPEWRDLSPVETAEIERSLDLLFGLGSDL